MTLRTLLLGRLLPTFIGLASLAMVMGLDLEFATRLTRRFHWLPIIGIFLIWFPDSPLVNVNVTHPAMDSAIRAFGWLLIVIHVAGVLLMMRQAVA